MKKIIEVDSEAEKILTQICDAALKGSGMAVRALINSLESLIKSVEEKAPE